MALLLVVLGRIALMIIKAVMRLVTRRCRDGSRVVGAIAGVLLLVGLVNGVIPSSFAGHPGRLLSPGRCTDPARCRRRPNGTAPAAQSLVAWNQLGRMGRRYVDARPTADELAAYAGPGARRRCACRGPATGDTPEERAQLALEELKRVGGFERKALIIITRPAPVGSTRPASTASNISTAAMWPASRCSTRTCPVR